MSTARVPVRSEVRAADTYTLRFLITNTTATLNLGTASHNIKVDLVDSTRLVERLGDARAAAMFAEHDRRSRDLLARHGGREIDRSDGFFLLFDDAAQAAAFALEYHAAARARFRPGQRHHQDRQRL